MEIIDLAPTLKNSKKVFVEFRSHLPRKKFGDASESEAFLIVLFKFLCNKKVREKIFSDFIGC